jgi:hypothetical protein
MLSPPCYESGQTHDGGLSPREARHRGFLCPGSHAAPFRSPRTEPRKVPSIDTALYCVSVTWSLCGE